MEVQKRSTITNGLRSLSSYLKKLQRSGDDYIRLNIESANRLKNIKTSIASKLANDKYKKKAHSKPYLIDDIKGKVYECEKIRSLGTLREKLVFSSGDPESDIMFIGEAPGYEEELKGMPFVGPSGQLLTKIINAMGLNREDVYISNIVKFRPLIEGPDQGTSNRKPSSEEMSVSLPYILDEIEVVKPKVAVALGGTAMQGLLSINGPLSSARGKIHDAHGYKTIVTYHPSYLLRSKSPNKDKRKLWEDMLMAMQILGLNISEKQKNYFK
tara:strand:+ start:1753 stop:2562 length:810 start_codon:yes stop_codon:yes gene_type:complete